ncbi:ABC transporter [Bacillus sp. S3]|uniref:ABC transporter n=1 Tax=Bacillus sp. S3 TaxID=486398 RepID=UPI00118AA3DC|nr:ABC transporter [Bacillus sp. S3]QCJ42914.1 ABC transporter [Bacillus sp. S3]
MSHGQSSWGIFGIFLGFITGAVWLLLAGLGTYTQFFELLGLGNLGNILNILIAIIGFLAFIVFGLFVFKEAWRRSR